MNQTHVETLQVPLSTELLDAVHCRGLSAQLNDFENAVFGPDFACSYEQIVSWVESGCLLYAAVCGEAVKGRRTILSAVSVFITTSRSRDLLLAGHIAEWELMPWTHASASEQPTVYFSSVMSDTSDHLRAMYDSLVRDVQAFRDQRGLHLHSGFGIASGPPGRRHMAQNGFQLLGGLKYRGCYDFMFIDAAAAATVFWRELLDSETAFFRDWNSKAPKPEMALSAGPQGINSALR